MFLKIGVLKNFANFNFIKKILQHKCFLMKFAKFLGTPFFTEYLRWLFPYVRLFVLYGDMQHSTDNRQNVAAYWNGEREQKKF